MTTTRSPVFRWGVYVGLCLPRRIAATPEARRPSTWSVASTTNHSLFRSAACAVHVFCLLIGSSVNHFHQRQPPGGSRAGRPMAFPRPKDFSHPCRRPLSAAILGERAGNAAHHAAQEALRDQLHLDEVASPPDSCRAHLAHPCISRLGGRAEGGPVVLADQCPSRARHRVDVQRTTDMPAAPPLESRSCRAVEVSVSVPPAARGVASVEVVGH